MISRLLKTIDMPPGENLWARSIMIAGVGIWLIFFTLGLSGYAGAKESYLLFSAATGAMLITGCRQKHSYGYLFLTVFLWLGLWLKLTIHTIFNYPYVEPIGLFEGAPAAWDEVLLVASVASLGVIAGGIAYAGLARRISPTREEKKLIVPSWYEPNRKWLWLALALATAGVLVVNLAYGIHRIGLAPKASLMWPLNSVVAWLLNIGLATFVALFAWWDITLGKNPALAAYGILIEAFLSSTSILSRAAYIFHAVPQLFVLHQFRHKLAGWSRLKTIMLAAAFCGLLVISISAVTTFRNYFYQTGLYTSTAYHEAYYRWEIVSGHLGTLEAQLKIAPAEERPPIIELMRKLNIEKIQLEAIMAAEKKKWAEAMGTDSAQSRLLLNEFGYQLTDGFSARLLQLSVDRWIGLEGLMAVQAYPGKDPALLRRGFLEKPAIGKPDIYQSISKSVYLKSDGTKFRFASLPGGPAFLYYSNSLWIVALGMVIFTFLVLLVELLIRTLTRNPILCSLYGVVMASTAVQFGVAPQQSIPYFLVLGCGILLVWTVHTHGFAFALYKLKLAKAPPPRDN